MTSSANTSVACVAWYDAVSSPTSYVEKNYPARAFYLNRWQLQTLPGWVSAVMFVLALSAVISEAQGPAEPSVINTPPERPPSEALSMDYTMNNSYPIEFFYISEAGTHYSYPKTSIDKSLQSAKRSIAALQALIGEEIGNDDAMLMLPRHQWSTCAMVQKASLFKNATVAIFGSVDPYFESIALALGANSTTTMEYNKLYFDHDNMHVVYEGEYKQLLKANTSNSVCDDGVDVCTGQNPYLAAFDVILSFSSFDHSGLGRYGDELNPRADIEAMGFARSLMKPGAVMFLTVPIGPDTVVFNLHRRYGRVRLPVLLEDFRVDARLGWQSERIDAEANWRNTYEPVLLL
jgi:hypothetical protein